MKNKTKKILCMLVVVCILATMLVGLSVSVQAATSVSVSTFTQLEAAVNNPNMDIIIIKNNITMKNVLNINRNIKFLSTREVSLLAANEMRHFNIVNYDITLDFNNIILDGMQQGGGIEINLNIDIPSTININNPFIQNCFSNSHGGAINNKSYYPEINIIGGILKDNTSWSGGGAIRSHGILNLYSITINGNYANGWGGGISATNDLNIYSSIIENNFASGDGGGIWNISTLNIYDSEFTGNTGGQGGAIFNNARTKSAHIENTDFIDNCSVYSAGAVYNLDYAYIEFYDCDFINNISEYEWGGAILLREYSSGTFNNCTFTGNRSKNDGGAIYSDGNADIYECTMSNNTSLEGRGGAIFLSNRSDEFFSSLFLNTCNINNNTSMLDGGAIYYDGEYNPNMFSVFDTTFSDNYSEAGGYYMYLPADITAYNSVTWNVTASSPFYYAFNNYDISYTNGILVP